MAGKEDIAHIRNGWTLKCHALFLERYSNLIAEVERLAEENPDGFHEHQAFKFLDKVQDAVEKVVPRDPGSPEFLCAALGNGGKWRRAKQGMPNRYRLFFQYSSSNKTIVYVWMNDEQTLRKAGAKQDVYKVFLKLTSSGRIVSSYDELMKSCADLPRASSE
jgi:toxin YhaV